MPKEFHVNCIRKPNRLSTHEHITHIGNNQQNWLLTRESAIKRIEAGEEAFYTIYSTTAKRAYVGVVREPGKLPYLRTHADGKWNDNLLAQPECGANCNLIA
jgi:hypothetical protein